MELAVPELLPSRVLATAGKLQQLIVVAAFILTSIQPLLLVR